MTFPAPGITARGPGPVHDNPTVAAGCCSPCRHGARVVHLVELFLPLRDNAGLPFPRALYERVRADLAGRFGGVTAFTRAPATGLWEDGSGEVQRDEVVLFEVMVDHVDHGWWRDYRRALEAGFRQDEVLVRATAVERL